jgi:Domain of unknown function (DUF2341)/Concanavalin A-like lectin/glucanases superfamily/Carbohydrate esterase, sialic acid-specific acetylesterase
MKSFLKHLIFTGLSLAALASSVGASVIASEGFDYPAQADNTPLGGSFTGGTGLSGSWQGAGNYRATGLTFSDLKVSGGCVGNTGSQIYYRPLSVNKTGTLWGSFLFNSVGAVDTTTTLLSYVVSKQANGTDYNGNTCFGVTPKRYQGTGGDIRIGGNTTTPNTLSNVGGTAVTQGVTYLILFKVEGLIATGGAAASQTVTSWILSSEQYDHFKSGGLTEAELNAAVQGGGATAVMQKTTLTATQTATFSATDFLTVQSNNAGDYLNDEFRFSDTSLAEVAPIAAPAAAIGSFGPGATVGPVVAGAAAISWTVPFGTNVANLAATYTYSAGSNCPLASGSVQNFTNPVHYILTSSDGLVTTDYTVTVTVAPASLAKSILAADFGSLGLATISGNTVTLFVSPSQAVTSLTPTFTLSPFATINPTSGVAQNFTSPQIYTVTAQNGTTQDYTVSVQSYGSWSKVASFFILTTPDGANVTTGAPEVNFPVLLRLTNNNFNFTEAQSDGRDIRFTTASGLPLSYQIEQWDSLAGNAAVWIKIPSISANARQEVKMYWGKSGVSTESSGLKVFNTDNGYCSVLHLNGSVTDATGSISPVNSGATASTGVIGTTAMNLGGSGAITASNITNFPSGTNPTSSGEVWIRPRQISSGWAMPLAWGRATEYGWNTWGMHIGFWTSPMVLPAGINCMGPSRTSGATALQSNRWYHITYSTQGGVGKVYVNGVLDGTSSGGALTLISPQSLSMSSVGGDIDVDEARISSVARSANWAKLSYENQKPQQSLVGMLVQPGSAFAVAPSSVSILEGAATTLTGQAGGAQSVKWTEKKNGVDTEMATNQLTLPVNAGRTTGTSNYIIQFKASAASGPDQTLDIPVTIIEDLADPEFTLTGPSTWNGRQTITVTPNITNLANLQAKGIADLTYTWSVDGVAATKTVTTGTPTVPAVMTLTRSQGSGPLTIKLVLNNGGALTTATKTINVTEPASDPYIVRTPSATEIPVSGQFYARDDSGMGKIYYNGTQGGSPNSVFLKVYTTDTGVDVPHSSFTQSLVDGKYTFTAPIAAARVTYKVVYGTTTGGVDTVVNTVGNLVCGDAYIFEGQSNAEATFGTPGNTTTNPWIRTYGSQGGGWGNAVRNGGQWTVGYFAYHLALRITTDRDLPICIINGAAGGTRIDQHQANPADHTSGEGTYNIYANLLNRVIGAKLTHGIRGIIWHQGENNSGAADPTTDPAGDYDYKSYQKLFVQMSAAWKQDYPNFERYIVFQVMPLPCGQGPKGDQLREAQRTLPDLFSKMDILTTLAAPGYDSCHYSVPGYEAIANLTLAVVNHRLYNIVPVAPVTAPVLKQAYFANAARTAITLVFDQAMSWSSFSQSSYYINKVGGKVTSGSASGSVITLQLNSAAPAAASIDYLQDSNWNFMTSIPNLLYGANTIPALTFADVPIGPATAVSAYNAWASNPALGLTAGLNDGAMSDPDRDGMTNLMEFTLGSMPMVPSPAMLPQLVKSGESWNFEYSRNDASLAPATTQIIEYGSDLTGWTAATVPFNTSGIFTITDGSPADAVKVAIPAGGNSMFVRLKVIQP